jgi:hypothetical protein
MMLGMASEAHHQRDCRHCNQMMRINCVRVVGAANAVLAGVANQRA